MRPGPAGRNPKRSRLRRRRLPGPAPAGGPTSCAPKKSAEEGRSRGLPPVTLRNPREYLASTRRLPPLPTGTLAESSIQVADAPNNAHRMARRGPAAENNARSGRSRALRACAASPRSFPPSRGTCERNKSGRVSPMGTPGTVPETLGQRHCARGAAAGGVLYTRPLIREPGAADFGRRPTGGGAGVKGA